MPITIPAFSFVFAGESGNHSASELDSNFNTLFNALNNVALKASDIPSSVQVNVLSGLRLSNDVGTPNTILDIAQGAATSNQATIANRVLMVLASAFTKTSSAWAVGSGNGGLATGAAFAASTTYHVFLIQRPDTGVVDLAWDTSATGANIATNTNANYTNIRRIGSFLTDGAAHILAFNQDGDEFLHASPFLDVNAANPGTAAVTAALTVPSGVKMKALVNVNVTPTTNGTDLFFAYLSSLDVTDQAPSATVAPLASYKASGGGNVFNGGAYIGAVRTNTSAQIRYRCGPNSGAADTLRIATLGWIDRRGRDD